MKDIQILKITEPQSGSVWDIFNLDSFNRELKLTIDQTNHILDTFSGEMGIVDTRLKTMLAEALFVNMGGDENTSARETMSFMYVLLATENFRFKEFNSCMLNAIQIESTFRYAEELQEVVPAQCVQALLDTVDLSAVKSILIDRHKFPITTEVSNEAALEYTAQLFDNVPNYFKGGGESLEAFKQLFNN